ncbi:alpha/beta fold hydrolase [Kutzneria sp. NPDC052558]|uniref:alpha/beta fold hydrolase n=1 Tax=Kutzneria sp. NPDC052558 TaxID=3364121 RepID=UPI0037CC60C8
MTTMTVPGATLYYEVRGQGPTLLISQSGEGDANRTVDLVNHLVDDHTVITYDRRGLSRSTLTGPPGAIADHADDVHLLLAELTDEPVAMLGCSLGAVIGLHLAVKHPGQLHTLVAHEPVAPWLLPDADAAHHRQELLALQEVYASGGLAAAFPEIARVLGIDPAAQDTEPDLTPQPLTDQRRANFDLFIRHDFTAVVKDSLTLGDLSPALVVPAAGRTTPRTVFDYRCAQLLAALVGHDLAEFPGGHNGNTTHPKAYAEKLREVLG